MLKKIYQKDGIIVIFNDETMTNKDTDFCYLTILYINFKYISSSSYRYAKYTFYGSHENFYFDNIQPNVFSSNNLLKEKIKDNYIDKFGFVCNKSKKECKIYNKDFKPLFYDTKHLTVDGYFEFGNYLKDKI